MENKYYTPTIEEFHVGFEYEMKERFMDGTVKTQKDFDNSKWIKCISDSSLMYVERSLKGLTNENNLCGIRVKHLDDDDIYDLDFCPIIKDNITVFSHGKSELKGPEGNQWIQFTSWTLYKGEELNFIIERNVEDTRTKKTKQETIFNGILKNKSELQKLMVKLGIY